QRTRDLRVDSFRPLLPPAILLEELPLSERGSETVSRSRDAVTRVLTGEDDRLVIVVGPCSIHDPVAAIDYARRLKRAADEHAADLCIVMRVYFEKPRTTVGWKGLINDPRLDGSFAINEGLRLARRLIDCSDGNSGKDRRGQSVVAHDIATQVAGGETAIVGVMMESFLVEGRQDLTNTATLRYGQSITDACMSWDATLAVLSELAKAVSDRRRVVR